MKGQRRDGRQRISNVFLQNVALFLYNEPRFGKNNIEVINVKEKVNQMFKDKLFLVMLVLGLLTMVAAAGVITVQRQKGKGENPYLEIPKEELIAKEEALPQTAADSQAGAKEGDRGEE